MARVIGTIELSSFYTKVLYYCKQLRRYPAKHLVCIAMLFFALIYTYKSNLSSISTQSRLELTFQFTSPQLNSNPKWNHHWLEALSLYGTRKCRLYTDRCWPGRLGCERLCKRSVTVPKRQSWYQNVSNGTKSSVMVPKRQ